MSIPEPTPGIAWLKNGNRPGCFADAPGGEPQVGQGEPRSRLNVLSEHESEGSLPASALPSRGGCPSESRRGT